MNERLYGLSLRLMAQNYALFTYRPNPFCFFCEEGGGSWRKLMYRARKHKSLSYFFPRLSLADSRWELPVIRFFDATKFSRTAIN